MTNHKILLFGATLSMLASGAFAAPSVTKQTVTTAGYVDKLAATKQDKLSGTSGYAVTYGATAGTTNGRQIVTSLGTSTSAPSLPTTGAVVAGLKAKQNILNGTAGTVVTYTGIEGGTGSRGVYKASGSYSTQTDNLAEAGHVNTAVANAFNAHLTCHRFDNSGVQTAEHCLLWNVNNLSGTYMPENQ